MSFSSETNKTTYAGDGSTASFSTGFTFAADNEIEVTLVTDATGAEAVWTDGTEYTLTGAGTGNNGTLTVDTSPTDYTPASGETLVIYLKPALTQPTKLPRSGNVSPKDVLEPLHDKRVRQVLYLKDLIDRSLKASTAETSIGDLPNVANRKNKILGFDASGDPEMHSEIVLPASLTALNFIRVNSGGTDYEMRTAAQVLLQLIATESAGILAHTDGSGAVEPRTITGTANEITVTNGDGVSGNPTASLPTALTFTGKTVTGGTLSGIAAASTMSGDPTTALNIATKQYVDSLLAGLAKRGTVRAATTGAITISTALNNGDTLDGVTLATDDLVLVKDQTSSEENGIYVVGAVPARDDLYDTYDEHPGALIHVEEGSTNADKLYHCTSNQGGTLDTTAITWANIVPGSGGTVTSVAAGNGMNFSAITTSGTVAAHNASETQVGVAEISTVAEINTGTDNSRIVSPDGLAGSNFGTAVVPIIVFNDSEDCATGDGAGDIWFRVPSVLNGMNLVGVAACCQTAGTTGTMDVQVHNVTQAADMLSTVITIDSAETDSSTAATPAVIDTANDDVATGDQLRIDVDGVHTTPAKGLLVELQFRLP